MGALVTIDKPCGGEAGVFESTADHPLAPRLAAPGGGQLSAKLMHANAIAGGHEVEVSHAVRQQRLASSWSKDEGYHRTGIPMRTPVIRWRLPDDAPRQAEANASDQYSRQAGRFAWALNGPVKMAATKIAA
ncbi:hypothetical protein E2P81_ATG00100 [Venturia nashicola]|uniref:Uncharacterized protein n=1 Tax=Venturia nashicola TaxID=86259 RepID=A0A4Z1PV93_9PEZI|nr:hypothetical protein E6O75_ATG00107 [Venturia nashicola]TLD39113.1 hypothetical protein E2P81_ATG00100 [Venturia nashicola]